MVISDSPLLGITRKANKKEIFLIICLGAWESYYSSKNLWGYHLKKSTNTWVPHWALLFSWGNGRLQSGTIDLSNAVDKLDTLTSNLRAWFCAFSHYSAFKNRRRYFFSSAHKIDQVLSQKAGLKFQSVEIIERQFSKILDSGPLYTLTVFWGWSQRLLSMFTLLDIKAETFLKQ